MAEAFFELRSPRDMLEKAQRELERMETNLSVDTVFNFFVTVYHVKDYVEATRGSAILKEIYGEEDFVRCQYLCNKGKHLRLRSEPKQWGTHADAAEAEAQFAVVVDGNRIDVLPLGQRLVERWRRFFEDHHL